MKAFSALALVLWLFTAGLAPVNAQEWPQDKDARQKFAEETTDQAVLAKLAAVETNWLIGQTAVDKITDQKLLGQVAQQTSLEWLGRYVVKKITDESVLAEVAIHGRESFARWLAIEKVTSQEMLAKIAMSDSEQAQYALKPTMKAGGLLTTVLTDPKLLAEVALYSRSRDARFHAIIKVSDQKVLAEIALNDPDSYLRGTAASRLTDQATLAKYLGTEKDARSRKDAVRQVTDEVLLKQLALADPATSVRAAAVEVIRDQAFLKELLRKESSDDPYQEVWKAACARIADAAFLAEIAKSNEPARFLALDAISEQALLADVAKSAAAREVRLKALSRLTDGQVQAQTAATDPDAYVREEAAKWPLRMVGTIDTTSLRYQGSISVYFVPVDEAGGMSLKYRDGQITNLKATLAENYRTAVALGNRRPTQVGFVLEIPADRMAAGQRFTLAVGFVPPAPPGRPYGYNNPPQERVSPLQSLDGKALATFRVEGLTRRVDIGTVTVAAP